MTTPAATRVVLIRHGETAWNADTRVQGHLDIALNDRGRWQAARMAQALADEGIEVIVSSDLQRARSTAQALADVTGLPLQLDTGLRERRFGCFEGHTFQEVDTTWPQDALRWRQRDPDFAPAGGGESLVTFYARCVGASEAVLAAHAGRVVALVAHGGVLDCLYRAATRQPLQAPRSWQLGNATINRLLHSAEGFTLVGWHDARHLEAQ